MKAKQNTLLYGFLILLLLVATNNNVSAQEASTSIYTGKLNDVRAVYLTEENFGVHADGKGDDAPALQKAINTVEEKTKNGVVYIPEGFYRLGKTVNLWRGIRLIGYGKNRPVFMLATHSPGYLDGEGKYMVRFCDRRTPEGVRVLDGTPGTLFSGISNVDFRIEDGNPAAIAVRYHVAQHSFLDHINFYIGTARAAVEEMGNEVEDCKFFGGEWAIKTGLTSAGWQSLVMDCSFEGQRKMCIESKDAGLTVIRCTFDHSPNGIQVLQGNNEKLYVQDSWFENIPETAISIGNYFDPRTQVSFENVKFSHVPVCVNFALFPGVIAPIPGDSLHIAAVGNIYTIAHLAHGLYIEPDGANEAVRKFITSKEIAAIGSMGELAKKDIPALPVQSSWVNIVEIGAKGDGKTDDTRIFQDAIKKYNAIYIPMGSYLLTETLVLKEQTALMGMHPAVTQFILKDTTKGFGDTTAPRPLLITPKNGRNIITGIGIDLGYNPGAIGVKWLAGPDSYLNDIHFPGKRSVVKGTGQYYSIWVADGGGGIFKSSWTPSELARCAFFVSNTKTKSRTYMLSIEHHRHVEVMLQKVENWTFYSLQTEEDTGSEQAFSVTMENCSNISFINLFSYRRAAIPTPFISAVKINHSHNINFQGMHIFSSGPFPYDNAVFIEDMGSLIRQLEVAKLTIQ